MLIEANDHEPFEEAFGCEVVRSAEDLLPLVYDELRRLAARRLAKERPDQTLQATALVHEAYMRLVKSNAEKTWDGRRHFFAAAAEAMRRILVNRARDRNRLKRGGNRERIDLDLDSVPDDSRDEELLALDEAIESLEKHDEACTKSSRCGSLRVSHRNKPPKQWVFPAEQPIAIGPTPRPGFMIV